ncbi:MAG: hypothetical protein BIFFINMI_03697 [Phycisphaerae bacterium]|nr:hypothetical protein [Phycisphaerae bacterium]
MKLTLLISALLLASAVARAAEPAKAGLGLDPAKEKQLADSAQAALKSLDADGPKCDYAALAESIAAARKTANELVGQADKKDPAPVDTPDLPAKSPVVVPESATEAKVLAAWKEQLVLRVRSVYEVLADPGSDKTPLWSEAVGVPWYQQKDLTRRAAPVADALREAQVFATLLARPADVVRVEPGKVLFSDDLKHGTDRWLLYGPADTTATDQGLRRKNRRVRAGDSVMWTKETFGGNFVYELTFIPNNGGKTPGVLFPICGRPVKPDTDLSISVGETMDTYNLGVYAYHFSIHRGDTNICNGRKVGTGLHLIGSRTPDPAAEAGKPYRVTIGKWGNVVYCLVDGKLQHSYYDAGTFGPPLESGAVGVRHWGGADGTYRDVTVRRLEQALPTTQPADGKE